MNSYNPLKKEQVKLLASEIYKAVEELNSAVDYKSAFISIGYAKSKLNMILKQLKGELPII